MKKKITVKISGMHCVSCARNIENRLKEVPDILFSMDVVL